MQCHGQTLLPSCFNHPHPHPDDEVLSCPFLHHCVQVFGFNRKQIFIKSAVIQTPVDRCTNDRLISLISFHLQAASCSRLWHFDQICSPVVGCNPCHHLLPPPPSATLPAARLFGCGHPGALSATLTGARLFARMTRHLFFPLFDKCRSCIKTFAPRCGHPGALLSH